VPFREGYEPFVLAYRRYVPPFDEAFTGQSVSQSGGQPAHASTLAASPSYPNPRHGAWACQGTVGTRWPTACTWPPSDSGKARRHTPLSPWSGASSPSLKHGLAAGSWCGRRCGCCTRRTPRPGTDSSSCATPQGSSMSSRSARKPHPHSQRRLARQTPTGPTHLHVCLHWQLYAYTRQLITSRRHTYYHLHPSASTGNGMGGNGQAGGVTQMLLRRSVLGEAVNGLMGLVWIAPWLIVRTCGVCLGCWGWGRGRGKGARAATRADAQALR
jgi:hypothetical protein